MYPKIAGFIDSYAVLLIIGVISSILIVNYYFQKKNENKLFVIDFDILAVVAVLFGLISACLLQNLYNFIEDPANYTFTTSITFLGGLLGGAIAFFVFYNVWFKKHHHKALKDILKIAPAAITSAHFFGRIGCFLAGCCYGKESDSVFAMLFPGMSHKVLPTQLFEAIFLLVLTIVLLLLVFKFDFDYTMVVYLICYGIFRFLIEFIRGDDRGAFLFNISPSQFWSLLMIIGAIPLIFYIRKIKAYEK